MMAGSFSPLERIKNARVIAMIKFPFWGYLLMYLTPQAMPLESKTVATDGYNLLYDPNGLMNQWTDDELLAAIIHEVSHCAFGHIFRCDARNRLVWNFATDYAINWILSKAKLNLPKPCLLDDKYADKTAEWIYNDLMQYADENMKKLKALDDSQEWENAINRCQGSSAGQGKSKKDDDGEGEGEGSGKGNKKAKGKKGKGGDEGDDGENENGDGGSNGNNIQDKANDFGSNGKDEVRDEEWWNTKVQESIVQIKQRGDVPGYLKELINDISEPRLSWRDILWNKINTSRCNDYRLMPPQKKYLWSGLYMPSVKSEHLDLAIAIDTSGSISTVALQQFLAEVKEIAATFDSFEIHYMQCDTQVCAYDVLTKEDEDDWPQQFYGRGGTRFEPVFEKMDEENIMVPVLVYMTDLYGSFPAHEPTEYDVIWITETQGLNTPFGEQIYLDINQRG